MPNLLLRAKELTGISSVPQEVSERIAYFGKKSKIPLKDTVLLCFISVKITKYTFSLIHYLKNQRFYLIFNNI